MARRVTMHVGLAKTGTTYLQRVCYTNRRLLKRNGVLYPGAKRASHFKASLDLREVKFKGHEYPDSEGAWSRLADSVNGYDGTALVSHETLGRATPSAIDKALSSFDTDDVQIVFTVRDLARQVPAVWQEQLKNQNTIRYQDFLDAIFGSEQGRQRDGKFWTGQDIIALAKRWADVIGPQRVTLVTVPPSGGDPQELWRRYREAVGLPDLDYDLTVAGNSSLGVVEAEILRRLNPRLPDLTWPEYEYRIKRRFAEFELGASGSSGRIVVPLQWQPEVERIAADMRTSIETAGYRIVGDLDDLRPTFPESTGPLPDELPDDVVLDHALRVLGRLAAAPDPEPVAVPKPRSGRKARQPQEPVSYRRRVRALAGRARARIVRG
ncbi:MAG TPA: hypothetical protein VES21_04445 [Nocardioidaceae bacterium]|nr:hypothetical protein [Nocardioidaceae bacterium]